MKSEHDRDETKKNLYSMDMCHGSILPKLLAYTLPLLCSGILQLLFNAADVVVVGRYCGENSMAAVGSTTSLINLLTNLFLGLSIGSNVLVAKNFGANKKNHVQKVVHTSMALSGICGLVLTIFGLLFAKQILIWMKTPAAVLPLAVLYLRVYFIGISAVMIYNFGNAILRAVGDTKRPLYYLLFSGIINVLLNLFFVVVCHMDVAGVGLATVISECISAFLIVRCLMKEKECYQFVLKKLRMTPVFLWQILRIGIPAGIYGTVFSLSNVVIQSSVNSFGATVMAGNAAAMNLEGFVYMAMNSFSQAAVSFTGQNFGAGHIKRIGKIACYSLVCVFLTGLLMGQGVYFFGDELLSIYSDKKSVIEAGILRMSYICRTYFFCGMMDVMVGLLRGLGRSVLPTVVSMIGACGLRLLWIFTIFRIPAYHNPGMLYFSYPMSWTITFLVHLLCFGILYKKLRKEEI